MPHKIIFHTDLIAFARTQSHLGRKAKLSCWRNQPHCGAQWAILGNIKMPNQSAKRLGGTVLSYGNRHREYKISRRLKHHLIQLFTTLKYKK